MVRCVAVFLDASSASRARLNVALALAGHWHARVNAVFVELPRAEGGGSPADAYARGAGIAEVVRHYHEIDEVRTLEQRHALEAVCASAGLCFEWRTLAVTATLGDALAQCRCADLAILAPVIARHSADQAMFWSGGHIVLAAGIPCVFIPEKFAATAFGRRAVIGWNRTPQARRAIGDALSLLVASDAVTVVIIDPKTGATDDSPGADIAQLLAQHGVRAEVEVLPSHGAPKGEVLLERARVLGADLIVAGAYGHSRVVEFVLGSTTRLILERARVPVLLAH